MTRGFEKRLWFAKRPISGQVSAGVAEASAAAFGFRQVIHLEKRGLHHRRDDELGDPVSPVYGHAARCPRLISATSTSPR